MVRASHLECWVLQRARLEAESKEAQQSGQERADSKHRDLETLSQYLWWQLTHHLMSLLGAANLVTCCRSSKDPS